MTTGVLASWNDTPTRAAIVDFVERVTTEGGPDFVLPSERARFNATHSWTHFWVSQPDNADAVVATT